VELGEEEVKVMKFGGGTVSDGPAFRRVGDVVLAARGEGPVAVVLSAVRGVTDILHAALEAAVESDEAVAEPVRALEDRHRGILVEIVGDEERRAEAARRLTERMARLERVLYGVAYTEEITPRVRDYVVSFGERLSALLLAAHLAERGVPSRALEGDDAGIATDGAYGMATARLDATAEALGASLRPEMEKGLVPVITGYFGAAPDGSTVTFGRGGSDYSAGIVGYALDADVVEVWKDVPGFMSADPKEVPGARPIASMSYDEAAELAYFGAKVLHPRIVEPCVQKNIPIRVRNLYEPEAEGTRVGRKEEPAGWVVESVASKSGIAMVTLYGPAMAYTPGIGEQVFRCTTEAGVNVYTMAASMASFCLVIEAKDAPRAVAALEAIRDGVIHEITTEPDLSLICVVGEGLRATRGIAARAFQAVAAAEVNVELISDGGSDIALTFVVKTADEARAAAALHKAFIEDAE
jgi:aspartate kinase